MGIKLAYFLFFISVISLQAYGINVLTLKHCCGIGTVHGESGLPCGDYRTPFPNVQKEDEARCLKSVDVCCKNKFRENQCNLGQDDAMNRKECVSSENASIDDFRKDCCAACQLGMETGGSGQSCSTLPGLGSPYDNAFITCCKNVDAQSKTTPTTPKSITTGTSPTASNSETNPTDYFYPPLEDICGISDICAQICIPTNGSFKCDCYEGYTLMADGASCKVKRVAPAPSPVANTPVDRCYENNPCDHQCKDTGVSIQCSCYEGFELDKDKVTCNDIDECALGQHVCLPSQTCINEPGSYNCGNDIEDYDMCPDGYVFNADKKVCDDFDECQFGITCGGHQTCVNTIGSYECVDNLIKCPPGFFFKDSIQDCEDIDECILGQHDCNTASQMCLNTKGNFTCVDKTEQGGCPPGFKKNAVTLACEDINECEENEELCGPNEVCQNEHGGHTCVPNANSDIPPKVTPYNYPSSIYTSPRTTPTTTPLTTPSSTTPSTTTEATTAATTPTKPRFVQSSAQNSQIPQTSGQTPWYPHPATPHRYPDYYRPQPPTVPTTQSTPTTPKTENHPQEHRPQPVPISCPTGFRYALEHRTCIDINECYEEEEICDSNQDCINTHGSYHCDCKRGFTKDITGACVDINECQLGTHDCSEGQRCDNTIGSFYCPRTAGCGTGYTLNHANNVCEDDDECALGTDNCRNLGPQFQCKNTLGSYRCERISRLHFSSNFTFSPLNRQGTTYSPKVLISQNKKCLPGYVMNSYGDCVDIDECKNNPCARSERCVNQNGRYQCISRLQCKLGYELDQSGTRCVDIDECARGTHRCSSTQICKNGIGYHVCSCPPGHKLNVNNHCEDVNECEYYRGRACSNNAECINTVGSFECRCNEGLRQAGHDICEDIDECSEIPGLCQQKCVNLWGSYRCSCDRGYVRNDDNRTCSDIDECEKFRDDHLCIGICQNTPGSYVCSCPGGYRLGSDGRTCQDIDECLENVCGRPDDICLNTRGNYKCFTIDCPPNYIKDPDHKSRCKRAKYACDQRDHACLDLPQQYSYHFMTFISKFPILQGHIDFFQMRGPIWPGSATEFSMKIANVICPPGIERAHEGFFRMNTMKHKAILALVRPIEGPQEIELHMELKLFYNHIFNSKMVAKIFLVVSEYQF